MVGKSRKRILLVEDEPELRRSLESILLREGYEVHTAEDGVEALESVSRMLPDAIVSDVMMPRKDGVEMLRALRDNLWGCAVPVIFYTNYPCGQLRPAIEKLSAFVCLPKAGSTLSELLSALETCLDDAQISASSLAR